MSYRNYLKSLNEATMTYSSGAKYLLRVIEVIKEGKPLLFKGGISVVIKYNTAIKKLEKSAKNDPHAALQELKENKEKPFTDISGKSYAWTEVEKSIFTGVKSTTSAEDKELSSINRQLEKIKNETGLEYVPIRVGKKTHKIVRAETTFGTPKSDFHLIDEAGHNSVWISHKDGKGPRDFQQWGGVSAKEYPIIPKDVETFVSLIKKKYGDSLPRATTVAMKIKDKKLKMQAIYGVEYGKSLGEQNVSVLLQGPISLVKKGKFYVMDANNVHYNGDDIKGDFEPVLMAIYKGDRSNFGIGGARFGILPIKSRKVTEWL